MELFKGLFVIVAAVISVTRGAAYNDDVDIHGEGKLFLLYKNSIFFTSFNLLRTQLILAICSLPDSAQVAQRSVGCSARIPSWTYRWDNNQCVQFEYKGCGGNANRFFTLYECEKACKKY
uniref:BPTI/Kunitz inhibitor domain-containing protein n=1 Tax=Glossina pallidipes TaxID=7398 RepID=A0A1A9ZVQ7_GLOPL